MSARIAPAPPDTDRLWSAFLIPGFFMLAVAIISGHGVASGLASHGDSRDIIEKSVPAILRGSYYPSRSYGNPLYEYAAAILFSRGGLLAASLYSLALALGSILVFNRLLDAGLDRLTRFCALMALCLNPLFLINAFAVTEWMQTVFLLLALLWFVRVWQRTNAGFALASVGLFSALLVLTRPDAAIVCACVAGVLMWEMRFDRRRSLALLATLAVAAAATLAIIGLLNHGFSILRSGVNFSDAPYWRRLIVAIVGLYSTFGPIAPLIVLIVAMTPLRRSFMPDDVFWARLFLVTAPIVFIRFVVMPDKLEYILYLVVLATLMLAHRRVAPQWLLLYAISLALPSIVTLSLFERVGITDHLSLHPRLGPGAIAQDLRAMRYNWRLMHDPALLTRIDAAVYGEPGAAVPRIFSKNWAAGLLSDSGDLIIGEPEAYHLDNPRAEPKYRRRLYHDIYLCNRSVWVNGSYGWRLAEPALVWPRFDDSEGSLQLTCYMEAPANRSDSRG